MAFSETAENAAVDGVAAKGGYISLHSADPGTTGANEISGVGRQKTTWGAAASGTATGSQVTYPSAPAADYKYFGVWTAATGGTFLHGNLLTPEVTLGAAGKLNVTPSISWGP